ncbi:hypothetical protein GCM10009629_56710 [Pseudonocardia alni]
MAQPEADSPHRYSAAVAASSTASGRCRHRRVGGGDGARAGRGRDRVLVTRATLLRRAVRNR